MFRRLNLRPLALAAALAVPLAVVPTLSPVQNHTEARAAGPASVADLADSLIGAVVNISTSQKQKSGGERNAPRPQVPDGSPFQDFFDEFFKNRQPPGQRPRGPRSVQSLGSGFVIDPDGIVITNNHVIAEADEITVEFTDGTELKAEVIGTDPKTDIAVLKVNPGRKLKSVAFGKSKSARVGDWVLAIGNPFGQGSSVSIGIVSAINRDIRSGPYDAFIQTDAAINRGNSGGPLFNMAGEVIGINTAIISPSGGSIGLGFSIPSDLATNVVQQLREFGETRRGWLGVSIQPVTDDIADSLDMDLARGALIAGLSDKGPAKISGFEIGDVILDFDGRPILEMRDLPRIVADTPVGKTVDVVVLRKGKRETLPVTLGRLEDGERAAGADAEEQAPEADDEGEAFSALGMTFGDLDDAARSQYGIDEGVSGALVTAVEENTDAAEKGIKPGSVISEVGQESVSNAQDVEERLSEIREAGRTKALMLVAAPDGSLNFIVLSLD